MDKITVILLLNLVIWCRAELLGNVTDIEENSSNETSVSSIRSMDYPSAQSSDLQKLFDYQSFEEEMEIEPEQSESSNVNVVNKSHSEFPPNFKNLLKDPKIKQHLEILKKTNPNFLQYVSQDDHVLNSFLHSMAVNNLTNGNNKKNIDTLQHRADTNSLPSVEDSRKYFAEVKKDDTTSPNQNQVKEFNPNHKYVSDVDWAPLIDTKEKRIHPVKDYYREHMEQSSHNHNQMPIPLANFYSSPDHNMLHAYETQNKDQKEMKDQTLKLATVKEILSNDKDVEKMKGEKMTSLSFKQGSYANVDNDNFHQYLSCCDQLFKNYGNPNYVHEDIYLIPKEVEDLHKVTHQNHQTFPNYSPKLKPVSYLRGYPLVGPEGKLPLIDTSKAFQPEKHSAVDCIEKSHHHPHIYYPHNIDRAHHLVPMYGPHGHIYRPILHAAPPALLLKKKLALIGKKYLFG